MVVEIILIVIGIGLVVAGYLIPAGRSESDSDQVQNTREQIEELVNSEVEKSKGRIDDMVDETINYAIEKTERSMDRLSNEKMMAVSEYSDNVLEQIGKSHEEVVFLYDMLNDKHENLKETVAEATKAATEVKESIKAAESIKPMEVINAPSPSQEADPEPKREKKKPVPIIKNDPVVVPIPDEEDEDEDQDIANDYYEDDWENLEDLDDDADGPDISFNVHSPGNRNSNDRILELHKAGKSNMAIAKELGLGIGEVKLVIDLYKGQGT